MKYQLRCLKCNRTYPADEYVIKCTEGCSGLLRTEYTVKKLEVLEDHEGLLKYANWLPLRQIGKQLLENCSSYLIYESTKLAEHLGLKHLLICLNVYHPGSREHMRTGTFKDIEAELSFQRIMDTKDSGKPLVVASDGNVATAFIHYSYIFRYPVVLVVTKDARQKRIWSSRKSNPYVTLVTMAGNCDYFDAISLANELGQGDNFQLEGGAFNVARRDGVGTIMLETSRLLGRMPDHYFQALGSGPGAISMYEASLRLRTDGRYGDQLPKIHGSQNYPFVPMYDAWKDNSNQIRQIYQDHRAMELIKQVHARVLTNRYPAYSIAGGVFDVLKDTSGEFYSITNEEAMSSEQIFNQLEGYHIAPSAGVSVASLIQAVRRGTLDKDDYVLLNITGGRKGKEPDARFKVKATMTVEKGCDVNRIAKNILLCLEQKKQVVRA